MSAEEKFNCEQAREMLDEYFDKEISADNRLLVDEHLSVCSSCRKELDELASCVDLLKRAPKESLSVDFADNIDSLVFRANSSSKAPEGLGCGEAREMLDEYYDRELSAVKHRKVESHLEKCDECTEALAGIHSISKLLRSVPRETLKKDYSENIESLINGESQVKSNVIPFYRRRFAMVSAAAAALLFIVVSVPKFIESGTKDSTVAVNKGPELHKPVEVAKFPLGKKIDESMDSPGIQENAPVEVVSKVDDPKKPEIQDEVKPSIKEQAKKIATTTSPAPEAMQTNPVEQRQLRTTEVVVAYDTDEQHDLFSEMGVSTNEDGLYAIKL